MSTMFTHRFHCSIKRRYSLSRPGLAPLLLLAPLVLVSCAPKPRQTPAHLQNDATDPLVSQRRILAQLTDQILLALATRDFDQLPQFLAHPQKQLPGPQIAAALLGPDAATIFLDRWIPTNTQILFDQQALWATAKIPVDYRLKPNHTPRTFPFTFQFVRAPGSDDWKLHLP